MRVALKRDFDNTLRLAAKLEYGASIFCFRLAIRAEEEGYHNLSTYFKKQFAEEDGHARMLGGLIDKKERLRRNCDAGTWSAGYYYPLDGISVKYWAATLFFWFKKPSEFDWADILAFLYVIENFVILFYEVLAEHPENTVCSMATKILQEEKEQADYIKLSLQHFHPLPESLIEQWRSRVYLAAVGGLIDVIKNLIR